MENYFFDRKRQDLNDTLCLRNTSHIAEHLAPPHLAEGRIVFWSAARMYKDTFHAVLRITDLLADLFLEIALPDFDIAVPEEPLKNEASNACPTVGVYEGSRVGR